MINNSLKFAKLFLSIISRLDMIQNITISVLISELY